jgi:nicotinamidase/pyrazinamidase
MNINYEKTALLEVDIQNDFCPAYTGKDGREHPTGALAVSHGHELIGPLNGLAATIHKRGGKVLATQDWHPANHVSFAVSHKEKKIGDIILVPVSEEAVTRFSEQFPELTDPIPAAMQQILWPVHCLQNTNGSAFHDELDSSYIDYVFRKGYRKTIDSYSAFFENDRCTPTDLYGYLKEQGIDTLFIGGLALDYCVFYSVIDSLRLGLTTYVVTDACRGIDVPPGSIKKATAAMKERGALFCSTTEFE